MQDKFIKRIQHDNKKRIEGFKHGQRDEYTGKINRSYDPVLQLKMFEGGK